MLRQFLAAAAVLCLTAPAWAIDPTGAVPDPDLTPGVTRTASRALICAQRTGAVRAVSAADRAQVRRAYGLAGPRAKWCAKDGCEIDHLIPLELGGANDHANLFPQAYAAAHLKDKLENRMHALVCTGALPLARAQQEIARDWRAAYRKYVTAPR